MREASRKFRRLCAKQGHRWAPSPEDTCPYRCVDCGQPGSDV